MVCPIPYGDHKYWRYINHLLTYLLTYSSVGVCVCVAARQCPADMEWTECMATCGSTCESLAVVGAPGSCFLTAADCLPGCQCLDGTVYDRYVDQCVPPVDCNCHHKGVRYPAGTTIPVECNEWSVATRRECKLANIPFIRYNRLSNRLNNRLDNWLYRVCKHSTG